MALFVVFLLLAPASSHAQSMDPNLWGTDGTVLAVARSGNTVYLGGAFGAVGRNSGGGVPLNDRTGAPEAGFPRVTGIVRVLLPDGSGGWYLGGEFSAVGGEPRLNLAHVRADGTVADWGPRVTGKMVYLDRATVIALARWGRTLYVGGVFDTLNGQVRHNLAAVNLATGEVLPWAPNADSGVWSLAAEGHTVYAAGLFAAVGGQTRRRIAALDAVTGAATSWDPDADGGVYTVAVNGPTVYAGGGFSRIGGQPRNAIAALDAVTGAATEWNPDTHGDDPGPAAGASIYTIVFDRGTVYAGGYFNWIGGRARWGAAALDPDTGEATDWDPLTSPSVVEAIAVLGRTVYVGGGLNSVGGVERTNLAAIDAVTAAPTGWDPRANGTVFALAASGGTVYAGGSFGMMGHWERRAGLAALDATTGELKAWNPNPVGGTIHALVIDGGTVYVGGGFSNIGGQPRANIAAVDTLTGAATAWNPGANEYVSTMALDGTTLYAGGYFTQLSGQRRAFIGALDVVTGAVTPWNPDAEYPVRAIAVRGTTVYAGGGFYRIGGQPRMCLAALDAATGLATPWNPNPNDWVYTIAPTESTVYVGGYFSRMGAQSRRAVAALDARTGMATSWNPDPAPSDLANPKVLALAVSERTLYIGGDFSTLCGSPRRYFGAVDLVTGAVTSREAGADSYVWSFAISGNTVYAGGGFSRFGGLPCSGLAAFAESTLVIRPELGPRPLALAPIAPNPVHSSATIHFSLATAASVDLSIFDVQGRRVATVLRHEVRTAGDHDVPVSTIDWPEGFYFCRLGANGNSATRKLLVVK